MEIREVQVEKRAQHAWLDSRNKTNLEHQRKTDVTEVEGRYENATCSCPSPWDDSDEASNISNCTLLWFCFVPYYTF